MKILVDMNLSPRWAAALTDAGCPATHWSQIGQANATNLEILRYAAANDYIVLTHDLDFATILAFTRGEKPVSCSSGPRTSVPRLSSRKRFRHSAKRRPISKLVPS